MSKLINKFTVNKKILTIFLILFISSSCSSSVDYLRNSTNKNKDRETEYVFGTNYLPLFKDFEIIEEESTNFDTISGNIAISSYYSKAKLVKIKKFYMTILPQMGFVLKENISNDKQEHALSYVRNKDKLEISLKTEDGELLVKFLISSS